MLFTTTSKLYAKRRKRAKPKLLQNMVAYNSLFKQATRSLFMSNDLFWISQGGR